VAAGPLSASNLIDLHTHTTASDGAFAPPELVQKARLAGLSVLAITDHDTVSGTVAARAAARESGIALIPGIEISSVSNGRDVHILGYFIDTDSASLQTFLAAQREERLRRVREMGRRLAELGFAIDVEPILAEAASGRSVGRPQIAAALLARGHVATRDEAFDRFLEFGRAAFVARCGASPEEVVAVIHEAGGLASMAHPGLTRRDEIIPPLAAAGLDALEARHSDHDIATEEQYRALARAHGLLVTGGSDFHGEGAGHRVSRLGIVALDERDFLRLQR
jgi:predicted metal-dependent phosphoesterase TrpH